jgi:hypothetical protein
LTNLILRGLKALQIEKKKKYTSIQTSEKTLYIYNLLDERYDVTDGNEANKPRGRGRGRPRKTVTDAAPTTTSETASSVA